MDVWDRLSDPVDGRKAARTAWPGQRPGPTQTTFLNQRGRDNISILPLEWLSGKMKNPVTSNLYARFECYQPFFRSRGKLCPLPAGVSSRSLAHLGTPVRPCAESRARRYCFRHRDLDSHAVGKWKPRLWSR